MAAKASLVRIPWQVWAAVALVIAFPLTHCHGYRSGYSDGRQAVLDDLRAKEAAMSQKALEAVAKGNIEAAKRADQHAAAIAEEVRAIEKAEAEGGSPLDALF
jgi:nitroimidazol reductase NimA-like FMN-containing flavoprotein (pyridoxamine 5'-phosphate oxidase superfamily)